MFLPYSNWFTISQAGVLQGNSQIDRQEFGTWKIYEKRKETDYNTLPVPKNINRTEPYFETMVLVGIVTEITSPESETTITYSNDGLSKSGVGHFIIQSFIVNGK